jgi:hypothetical protein
VYAFDPGAGRRLNNHMTVQAPYEPLETGPVGSRIAVIDYDATNELYYEPVNLDHPSVLLRDGLDPSESDPRFHQQMVYAIACDTIGRFEHALGRPIRWRRPRGTRRDHPFHSRLRILPHAFQQPNAYYHPELRAVLLGYFPAPKESAGGALPGQTIFTCLSHDIVAHEMTHALVDGQREYLTAATGPDAAAFHEAFADIVALFQHFANKEALLETIHRTGGMIHRRQLDPRARPVGEGAAIVADLAEDNPLVGLAKQFGEAKGARSALRSAIAAPPNSNLLGKLTECHERGAILVAAVFDAFFTLYIKRTRDLMRIAEAGGAIGRSGELHSDLAARLASEASKTAAQIVTICIRALDYCPPLDLEFGEFLRALITADSDLVPEDPLGFRSELIEAFRLRGIIPRRVVSYSEEALRWWGPDDTGYPVAPCKGLDYRIEGQGEETVDDRQRRFVRNAVLLHSFARKNLKNLGLDPNEKVRVLSYHPIHRIAPSGKLVVDFVAELIQERQEALDPDQPDLGPMDFRGGATVIFDNRGDVRYVVEKSIDLQRASARERLKQQREFLRRRPHTAEASALLGRRVEQDLRFQLLHRGL